MSASQVIAIEVLASLFLLIAFLQPGLTQFLDDECGLRSAPVFYTNRIINGSNAEVTSSPWMVFILTTDDFFICGGSLITHRSYKYISRSGLLKTFVIIAGLVLTAAHCYVKNKHLKARMGEFDRDWKDSCYYTVAGDLYCNTRVELNVEMGIMHPHFNKDTQVNDIAILRLARRVEYTQNIRPICIVVDKTWRDYIDGMATLTATGWGFTSPGGRSSRILQTQQLSRQPPAVCNWHISRTPFYNEFCLGNEDSSVCNGDSGGPAGKLISYGNRPRFIQIGIASLTNQQCAIASMFTDVLSHVDWILSVQEQYGHAFTQPIREWSPNRGYIPSYIIPWVF